MKPQVETGELMERIRREARRHRDEKYAPGTVELPPPGANGVASLPPAPGFAPLQDEGSSYENAITRGLLTQAGSMIQRARGKTTVRKGIPKLLRPIYRNQGGYNDIVLETLECLRDANRYLTSENAELRGHLARQTEWLEAVERGFARVDGRFAAMERQNDFDQKWLHNLQENADIHSVQLAAAQQQSEDYKSAHREQQSLLDEERAELRELRARVDRQDIHTVGPPAVVDELGVRFTEHEVYLKNLQSHADGLGAHLRHLQTQADEQSAHTGRVHGHLDELGQHVNVLAEHIGEIGGRTDDVRGHTDRLGEHLKNVQAQADEQAIYARTVHGHLDELGKHVNVLGAQVGEIALRTDEVHGHLDKLGKHVNVLGGQIDEIGHGHRRHFDQRLDDLARRLDGAPDQPAHQQSINALTDRNARLERAFDRLDNRQAADASLLKSQLWLLQRAAPVAANAPAGVDAGSGAPGGADLAVSSADLDAVYLAFEDEFRGSRADVKGKLEVYLPYLREARVGTSERPLLDLGCGRGEWLEFLGEQGIAASGVDLNVRMIEECQRRGLPAIAANAVTHLASMPDASVGAVTAFHLIEHLPYGVLVRFLRECRRVVQPGGVAIFETPDPSNILVGAVNFYRDPTHQRPLPADSTRFLVEQAGFGRADVLPLHPRDQADLIRSDGTNESLVARFNELFCGPQDYAIVAAVLA